MNEKFRQLCEELYDVAYEQGLEDGKKGYRKGYEQGYFTAYDRGFEDGKKATLRELKTIKIKMPDYPCEDCIKHSKAPERDCTGFENYEERQTEKSCENCFFYGHCKYYGKTLTWLLGDKNEQTGEKVCKSWKPNGDQVRKESE